MTLKLYSFHSFSFSRSCCRGTIILQKGIAGEECRFAKATKRGPCIHWSSNEGGAKWAYRMLDSWRIADSSLEVAKLRFSCLSKRPAFLYARSFFCLVAEWVEPLACSRAPSKTRLILVTPCWFAKAFNSSAWRTERLTVMWYINVIVSVKFCSFWRNVLL